MPALRTFADRLGRKAIWVNVAILVLLILSLRLSTNTRLTAANKVTREVVPVLHEVARDAVRMNFNRYSHEELAPLYARWTMVNEAHQNFSIQAIERVNEQGVEGDVVECGVWKGGMSMAMIFANQRHNIDRTFWLFDTFEGLPPPDSEKDDRRAQKLYNRIQKGRINWDVRKKLATHELEDGKWNWGPLDVVKQNVLYTGYPPEKLRFVKGKVEDTLPVTNLPEKIAVLRLDTDWYSSTKAEMEYLYNRLQPGGILIVDDYCSWAGANNAIKEFFNQTLHLDAEKVRTSTRDPCFTYWKPLD